MIHTQMNPHQGGEPASSTLWGTGREPDGAVHRFTTGRDRALDHRLAWADLAASIAHARMLGRTGLVSREEAALLEKELRALYRQAAEGDLIIAPSCEDIHSHIEAVLTARLGEAGQRIHTGRSRNDQVLVALHIHARREIRQLAGRMRRLFRVLLRQARKHQDHLMPGYTHMQLAMPSSFGLWFGAWAEGLADDLLPLHAAYGMVDQNPLGTGAGYGSCFPLDRGLTTRLLGFRSLTVNPVYAQVSRYKAGAAVASALAAVASTLSRLAMDVCLYSGENHRFFLLETGLTTGSSIMPHKKNPDVFELIRARCNRLGTLPAQLAAIATNLPTGYHRDYQLLKEVLLPAYDELGECLDTTARMVARLQVDPRCADNPLYEPMYAVDAVARLTLQGMPFRQAYGQVARSVREGSYRAGKALPHTHTGSIGAPGFGAIQEKWNRHYELFDFTRGETAIRQLTKDP